MVQRSSVGDGSSGLRAALGELLVRLRGSAVDGVVPEQVFSEGVKALVLGDAERERLRHELARLGLPVQELHVHTDGDKRNGEKVAQKRGESVFPRIRSVHHLIRRYVDADGYVTSHVLDGVVKLAGLQAHEAARLRAETPVRDPEAERGPERPKAEERGGGGVDEAGSSEGVREDGEDGREGLLGETEADEADRADLGGDTPAVETAPGDLAEALAAAYAVLDTDRRERRPGSRLLSAQAEVGLAVLTRGGADHIAREPDEDELKALPTDDLRIRARDCLVLHNQRLVHSLVRPHLEQGLDYDDLLQHGFLGLLRAARKFDPTKGFKFSTYATWWIRQSITRAIADEGALIRIPVHMHEQMRKVARAERTLLSEGRPAATADVAVTCDMPLQKVEEIRRLTRRTDSLDRVIGDGATLADFVGRTHVLPSVERHVVAALTLEAVLAVLETFTEREHGILAGRLGLDGGEPLTLDELGRVYGVTRERIRQIEAKARPVFQERLRKAGLADDGLDAVCEEAEYAARRAAEAVRRARIARATHAARTAPARRALRKAVEERAGRAARAAHVAEAVERTAVVEESSDIPGIEVEAVSEAAVQPKADGETSDEGTAQAAVEPEAEVTQGESLTCTDVAVGAGPVPLTAEAAPQPASASGTETEPGVVANQAAADWERVRRMSATPVEQDWWLAEYALAALGHDALAALLGQPDADAVVRSDRYRNRFTRPVLTALEVLRRVVDTLVETGRRPEDYFDRPADALRGSTPRSYLTSRPLVHRESRLAVRDALREFVAAGAAEEKEPDQDAPGDAEPEAEPREAAAVPLGAGDADTHTEPEGGAEANPVRTEPAPVPVARATEEAEEEFERRLTEARVEAERELHAWEDVLLARMDTVLLRRERRTRAEGEARIAQLKAQHHEAYQAVLRRAESAEESVRSADDRRDRTQVLELRLRQYREGAEARIAELEDRLRQAAAAVTQRDRAAEDVLRRQREAAEARVEDMEARLRDTEAALARRDQALEAARRHAESTEQLAAQRVAQAEQNAWAQTAELQQQLAALHTRLAAEQEAARARSSFRDRWRRP
ncbi:sigma-70 family RNA polymerase sigma factor [Streptomyces sp. NPDC085927]|uniref:sigma-70 family RNA polymerase sigma factor n=1 Tax=Streptomyces sp. NPDC085927 TaxID=3365738 RepID=UPI0037D859E1